MEVFVVFGLRRGKWEALGGENYVQKYPTQDEAVVAARSCIGLYDSLEVRNQTDAVVWEMKNARSAPKAEE